MNILRRIARCKMGKNEFVQSREREQEKQYVYQNKPNKHIHNYCYYYYSELISRGKGIYNYGTASFDMEHTSRISCSKANENKLKKKTKRNKITTLRPINSHLM